MEIAIGNSTYYLDRLLFALVMQIAWTLVLSIGGILNCRKKDIIICSAVSTLPLAFLMLLFGDFEGASIFFAGAAIGCGIALINRRSVGAVFAVTTIGSFTMLLAGMALLAGKTGQAGLSALCILGAALAPAVICDSSIRSRIDGKLPRPATSPRREYDDGGCGFSDCGSGFGRSGSGY